MSCGTPAAGKMHASRWRVGHRVGYVSWVVGIVGGCAVAAGLGAACANGGSGAPGGDDASTEGGSHYDAPTGSSSGSSSGGAGGCDANTDTDWTNCGACGHACTVGDICNAGQCQANCVSPQTLCPGQPGCFDLTSDLHNCGTCGTQCIPPSGGATVACQASQCVFSCPADAGVAEGGGPIVLCDADSGGAAGCFDLTSTSDHCGSCGHQCTAGQVCSASSCCPQGNLYCGSGCIDVSKDPSNCGACGASCPSPAQCSAGKCTGYTTSNPTAAFLDACALPGKTSALANQGGGWTIDPAGLRPLPFTFTFYGTAQTQFWLNNQGTLGIGPAGTIFTPDGFPDCKGGGDPTTTYPSVVAFGDSTLATGPNGVCFATTGTAPNRQFVATWNGATSQSETGSVLTFSIVLAETTNTVDLMYDIAAGTDGGLDPEVSGTNATVGMQAKHGAAFVNTLYSCHAGFLTKTPFDVRFTPVP